MRMSSLLCVMWLIQLTNGPSPCFHDISLTNEWGKLKKLVRVLQHVVLRADVLQGGLYMLKDKNPQGKGSVSSPVLARIRSLTGALAQDKRTCCLESETSTANPRRPRSIDRPVGAPESVVEEPVTTSNVHLMSTSVKKSNFDQRGAWMPTKRVCFGEKPQWVRISRY